MQVETFELLFQSYNYLIGQCWRTLYEDETDQMMQ